MPVHKRHALDRNRFVLHPSDSFLNVVHSFILLRISFALTMAQPVADEAPFTQTALLTCWHFLKNHPLVILFLLLFVRPLFKRYSSPLRQFPGPFAASCTRLWKGKALCIEHAIGPTDLAFSMEHLDRSHRATSHRPSSKVRYVTLDILVEYWPQS